MSKGETERGRRNRKRERVREWEERGYVPHSSETLLVLIYTSMTTAQNELTVRREQQHREKTEQPWRKRIKTEREREQRAGGWRRGQMLRVSYYVCYF